MDEYLAPDHWRAAACSVKFVDSVKIGSYVHSNGWNRLILHATWGAQSERKRTLNDGECVLKEIIYAIINPRHNFCLARMRLSQNILAISPSCSGKQLICFHGLYSFYKCALYSKCEGATVHEKSLRFSTFFDEVFHLWVFQMETSLPNGIYVFHIGISCTLSLHSWPWHLGIAELGAYIPILRFFCLCLRLWASQNLYQWNFPAGFSSSEKNTSDWLPSAGLGPNESLLQLIAICSTQLCLAPSIPIAIAVALQLGIVLPRLTYWLLLLAILGSHVVQGT